MNMKARIERLEAGRPDKYVPIGDPDLDKLNRAAYNLRRMGLSLADLLLTMEKTPCPALSNE